MQSRPARPLNAFGLEAATHDSLVIAPASVNPTEKLPGDLAFVRIDDEEFDRIFSDGRDITIRFGRLVVLAHTERKCEYQDYHLPEGKCLWKEGSDPHSFEYAYGHGSLVALCDFHNRLRPTLVSLRQICLPLKCGCSSQRQKAASINSSLILPREWDSLSMMMMGRKCHLRDYWSNCRATAKPGINPAENLYRTATRTPTRTATTLSHFEVE